MSKRNDWFFDYSVGDVAYAAGQKANYHEGRKRWWGGERQSVVEQIRATGVEVREFEITGGKDAQVVIDPTLSKRLSECQMKIAEHERKAEEYGSWQIVLEGQNPAHPLELDHQDVLFFGLAEEPTEAADQPVPADAAA